MRVGTSALVLTLVCGTALAINSAAGAQSNAATTNATRPTTPASVAPALNTPANSVPGRDFGALRFQISPQDLPLEFAGQQAYSWREDGPAGTQRLLLQGDVRIRVGLYKFGAARAVVWMEPLEASTRRPGQSLWQVAIYLDRIGDPSAEAGGAQTGDRLLLTAIVDGDPTIAADHIVRERSTDPLVLEGEARLAGFLTAAAGPTDALDTEPQSATPGSTEPATPSLPPVRGLIRPGMSQPYEPGSPLRRAAMQTGAEASLADRVTQDPRPSLFSGRGVVTIAAGEPVLTTDADERVLIITGGAIIQYSDSRAGRFLQLSAQRAVVFMDAGPLQDLARAPADKVRGIYLEGDVVASDGRFNQRANQIYYDLRANRATLVDGVFWTYNESLGVPLYVRAKQIRQTAVNQIEASDVRISASAFFEPLLSLAAKDVTITREPRGEQSTRPGDRTVISGRDLTPQFGGLPFFYWPSFTGDVDRFPLKDVRVGSSSTAGAGLQTRWDTFGLLDLDPKADVRLDFLLDAWFKRGAGIGFDGDWRTTNHTGSVLAYMVPDDRGTDQLASGARRDRTGEFRGIILADDRWALSKNWSLFSEAAYVSDENFTEAYFETASQDRRELTNALTLQGIDGQGSFSADVRHNFNDFIANEYLLQSRGYNVSKLPEVRYTRVGDDLFAGWMPGLVTWQSDYRVSRMAMQFVGPTAAELGFETATQAREALGLQPNESIEGALLARGFTNRNVMRADTRQEVAINVDYGPIRLQPFAVGRVTAWDDKFEAFSRGNEDAARFWAAMGVRSSTTMQRVYDGVEFAALDIYRLRHIINPSVTAWGAGANRSQGELPTYDERVEALNEGGTIRAGVEQIFQTQRGGPGRYRSVDLFKLNTDIVWSSNDADRRSPFGRFFDDKPEYSALGKYVTVDGVLQLTDATAITGSTIYDMELNQQARSTIGATVEQSRDFSTYIELRFLNPRDATYLGAGADLRLTQLYTLSAQGNFDTNQGRIQTMALRLSRELPGLIIAAKIGYNDITQESTFGFAITPVGKDDRRESLLRRLGRDQIDKDLRGPGDEPTRTTLPGE